MRFLTFDQAQQEPWQTEYRYSTLNAAIGLTLSAAALIASWFFLYQGVVQREYLEIAGAGWIGLWALFFFWHCQRMTVQRMKPWNWLVRTHANGLSLKVRSYLNHHLDPGDLTVVFLPYSELRSVRSHKIRRDVAGISRGDTETRFLRFVEFRLSDQAALERIADLLAQERTRKAPMEGRWIRGRRKDLDYPVQVADGLLRVEWRVRPSLKHFVAEIAGRTVEDESLSTTEDLRALKDSSPQTKEDVLLQLIESGDRFGAIRTIRELYGYDLTRAVSFLDELQARPRNARKEPSS